jgi:hypothetical protein
VNWTNRTAPGIVTAARALNYGGPTNMGFLRLNQVHVTTDMPIAQGLGKLPIGLSVASPEQIGALNALLSRAAPTA